MALVEMYIPTHFSSSQGDAFGDTACYIFAKMYEMFDLSSVVEYLQKSLS